MSDISIPGVNSRFNTQQTVEKLVKVERTKLDAIKNAEKELEDEKKIWQRMSQIMTTLRTSARSLYSYDNPFAERSATSSDENSLTARASREAIEGTTRVEVLKLSQADRFSSASISKDMKIDQGTYTFIVGENKIAYKFHGGSVKDFVAGLNKRGEGTLKASLIQNKPDSQVLLVESLKTGAKWPMSFEDEAKNLALKIGLIALDKGNTFSAPVSPATLQSLGAPLTENKSYQFNDDTLVIKPGTQLRINLPGLPEIKNNMTLSYEVRAKSFSENANKVETPPGPQIPSGPGATVKGLTLPNFASQAPLPVWKAPEPEPVKVDDKFLWLSGGGNEKDLPTVMDSQEFQVVEVPIGKDFPGLQSLLVRNNNTLRNLEIRKISIQDPATRGNFKPQNPVSLAQDARIRIEGIDIERDSNVIKDAIPGVTLTLNDISKEKVNIKVEPDRKLVKDKLIEFVAQYNAVIREVNILTARKNTTDVVDEIDFFTDKEKEDAYKKLGTFQGDSTLNMIKSRLQSTMANPYKTGESNDLVLLNNAGISTNASATGGGVQSTKLRGYLEIDEKKLDKVMDENFMGLKSIFGFDSDGDLIADKGAGVELEKYIQPFIQIGGIIALKTSSYDTKIKAKNDEIKKFEDYLVSYEASLKDKYTKMEGAVNQAESSSKELNSLNNNSNN